MMVLVSQGCGLGLVPSSMAQMQLKGVRFLPLRATPMPVPAMLAWNPAEVSPALERFIASAARTIAALPAPADMVHSSEPDSKIG